MFEVENLHAVVDRMAGDGYGLVGGIGQHEQMSRMAYVRGPEGIIVALAERIDQPPPRKPPVGAHVHAGGKEGQDEQAVGDRSIPRDKAKAVGSKRLPDLRPLDGASRPLGHALTRRSLTCHRVPLTMRGTLLRHQMRSWIHCVISNPGISCLPNAARPP